MTATPIPLSEGINEVEGDGTAEALALAHTRLIDTTRRAPYVVVAAAMGVGVVLGGGIPNWVLRLVAASFVRLAAAQAVHALAPPPDPP